VNIKFANHKKSSPLFLNIMWLMKRYDTTHHHFLSGLIQEEHFKVLTPVSKEMIKVYSMKESVTALKWQERKI
jgi:hypothetical protein